MKLVRLQVSLERYAEHGGANDDMGYASPENLANLEELAKKAIESDTFRKTVKLLR